MRYGTGTELQMHIDGVLGERTYASELLLALVERGAFPGAQGELLAAPEDDTMAVYRPLLQSMHDLDMVELTEPGSSSWRLTQRGMASISYTWQLKDSARVLEPRAGIPLKDASTWEMMVQLEEQGWEWQALPAKRDSRDKLVPYSPQDEEPRKVWYTSGHTVNHDYLHTLLAANDLLPAGHPGIPHGQRADVYKAILDGKKPKAKRRARVLAPLEDDMEVDDVAALEDEVAAHPEAEADVASEKGGGDELSLGFLDCLEEALFDEAEDSDATPAWGDGDGDPDPPPDDAPGGGAVAGAPEAPAVDEVGPPAPDVEVEAGILIAPPALPGGEEVGADGGDPEESRPRPGEWLARRLFDNETGASWGLWRFTPVRKGPHGGYQARCQFHRRNLKTDCKQEFVVEGPEREDKYNCIRRLMYWCTCHAMFDRQRKHRAFKPTLAMCPPHWVS